MEKFSTDEQVVAWANDNTYGLAAYVWTKDAARGMRFANELQAGTVRIGNTRGGGPDYHGAVTKKAVSAKRVRCTVCMNTLT